MKDPIVHAGLKADAIMFYADLVMLAKSKDLVNLFWTWGSTI